MAQVLRLDALAVDLFRGVAGFLLGVDLLSLSHVNCVLLRELFVSDGDLWTQRAAGPRLRLHSVSAKQRYFQTRTFRFPGLARETEGQQRNDRGRAGPLRWLDGQQRGGHGRGAAPFRFTMESIIGRSSFSFGLWFALLPGGSHTYTGGILLGAQSTTIDQIAVTKQAQFIHVDPEGNLYCSVTTTKTVIAKNLEIERWYHLVLTFDKPRPESSRGVQSVYLDGERIHISDGVLRPHRRRMPYWQIGNGYMSNEEGEPLPGYYGWYGFNGMIDEFTVWNRALLSEEMRELQCGGEVLELSLLWSLQRAHPTMPFYGQVEEVRCSRPQERRCVLLMSRASS